MWSDFVTRGLSFWTSVYNTSFFQTWNVSCLLDCVAHTQSIAWVSRQEHVIAKNVHFSRDLDAKFNRLSWCIMLIYYGFSRFSMVYHHLVHFNLAMPRAFTTWDMSNMTHSAVMCSPSRPLTTRSCSLNGASMGDVAASSVSPWTEPWNSSTTSIYTYYQFVCYIVCVYIIYV